MRRWRRFRMGLETLIGRRRGFFAPYRHAAEVRRPGGYPEIGAAIAAAFAAPATAGMVCPADVLAAMAEHGETLAGFDGPPPRPRWRQSWYPGLDGAAAYAILRGAAPRRVIEVGSGHSTRFMAQAVADGGTGTEIVCIDPAPRAALSGLALDWRAEVLGERHLPLFDALGQGDVAFFDSSHLLWEGTDVDLILNRVFARLAPGVLVHVHDVFLPDPYPEAWAWRGYTEQLGLGGWILGGGCSVLWSSRHARTREPGRLPEAIAAIPVSEDAVETALWLVKW